MNDRTVATLGVLASLAVLAAVLAPYVLLRPAEAAGLETYYGYGLVGPLGLVLLVLVTTVAFAAGRQRRSDPSTVAGATIAVGLVGAVVAVEWAVAVDPGVVATLARAELMAYHRWALVGLAATVPLIGAAYARVLDLV